VVPGNIPILHLDRIEQGLFIDAALLASLGTVDSFYGWGGIYDENMLEMLAQRGVQNVWVRQDTFDYKQEPP